MDKYSLILNTQFYIETPKNLAVKETSWFYIIPAIILPQNLSVNWRRVYRWDYLLMPVLHSVIVFINQVAGYPEPGQDNN